MKMFDMIYAIVMAFKPDRHPWFAMLALTLLLLAFVIIPLMMGALGGKNAILLLGAFR